MAMEKHVLRLKRLGACEDAVEFAKEFTSAKKAWNACERGDWMIWAIGRTINCEPWTDGRKPLLACALDCALTVKHLWPADRKDKIAKAVGVLRKWIAGKVTVEQAQDARSDLSAYAAAADAAADAAAAAAYAADAADDDAAAAAAYAADAAADDAAAAYAAAAAAYAAAARTNILKRCAAIVRKHFQNPPA